jgi:hypothetical protein
MEAIWIENYIYIAARYISNAAPDEKSLIVYEQEEENSQIDFKKVDGRESFRYIKAEIIVIFKGARQYETILFIFNEVSTTEGN